MKSRPLLELIRDFASAFRSSVLDQEQRTRFQYLSIYVILYFVSMFMSCVNTVTGKTTVLWGTLIFSYICLINFILTKMSTKLQKPIANVFQVEFLMLFVFFIVTGSPEGFSAIWACMLPTCGMLLFGRKNASILSLVMLLIMLFLFDTVPGQALLQYEYTMSFKLRFPILFVVFYLVSLFLETVRVITHDELTKATEKYRFFYTHDALTGVYNRYGFNSMIKDIFDNTSYEQLVMLIVDIDDFKKINDTYGHLEGDFVLQEVASILVRETNRQVVRWGGEEFAVMLTEGGIGRVRIQQLCHTFSETTIKTASNEIHLTVSIGAVIANKNQKPNARELFSQVDDALYEAKETGKNKAIIREYIA